MKSKKQTKKLELSKVTIARLDQYEEANVKGGVWPTYWCGTSDCEPNCNTLVYTCFSCP